MVCGLVFVSHHYDLYFELETCSLYEGAVVGTTMKSNQVASQACKRKQDIIQNAAVVNFKLGVKVEILVNISYNRLL